MEQFAEPVEDNHVPEIVALVAQLIITIHTSYNLHRNKD